MNCLASVLNVADVKVDVVARNTLTLFADAATLFERHSGVVAPATTSDAPIAKEQLASTCLGHAVAIPHTRITGLNAAVAALVRLKEPLAFGGPDDEPVEPVTLFVFLSVPHRATQGDPETLAEIAEMLSDRTVRDRLGHDGDADFVYATIADWMPLGAIGPPDRRS